MPMFNSITYINAVYVEKGTLQMCLKILKNTFTHYPDVPNHNSYHKMDPRRVRDRKKATSHAWKIKESSRAKRNRQHLVAMKSRAYPSC